MEKLRSIFNFIYGYYLDYRYKVASDTARNRRHPILAFLPAGDSLRRR